MAHTKLTAVWSGFTGAPGYTKLSWAGALPQEDITAAATEFHAFFDAFKTSLPSTVKINFDGLASIYNDNGELASRASYTPPAAVVGTAVGSYAAASGAVISWLTDTIQGGRRVRGRTFIVPLAGQAYDPDGTITTLALGNLKAGADALGVSTPSNVIFSQPGGKGTIGIEAPVTAYFIADKAAVLRSRRD